MNTHSAWRILREEHTMSETRTPSLEQVGRSDRTTRAFTLVMLLALSVVLAVPVQVRVARAEEPLTVYYMERPPYYVTEDGRARGTLNDIAEKVLSAAAIPHRFDVLPAKRILEILAQPDAYACSVGWFKTPERDAYARFSRPIYRNRPILPLARRDAALAMQGMSLDDILSNKRFVLGALDGFSYGTGLDARIAQAGTRIYRFSGTQKQLVRMLAADRIDYMLVSPEETPLLLSDAGIPTENLSLVEAANAEPGNLRHLMCSKAVPEETMRRMNEAITRFALVKGD